MQHRSRIRRCLFHDVDSGRARDGGGSKIGALKGRGRCYVRLVLVDPEVLRALDAQVDAVAATISGLDVGGAATTAADGVNGSDTQWAGRQVGHHLGLAAKDIVQDIEYMGYRHRFPRRMPA
jgi:hypothetical protein